MADTIGCLDREELQAFVLGRLVGERETLLAEHVESCPECVRRLTDLEATDNLLDAAREPDSAVAPTQVVQRLIGRISQLSFAEADGVQELAGYLVPAESPAELGQLGPHRLLRVLGQGGMGIVFQAEDTALQRQVALKLLRPALLPSVSARQRFLREARAAARVVHERIGSVLHVGEERGVPYLIMPLLEGETLEARLQREPILPVAEVIVIGRQIAEGLAAAHGQGLIHRDVKPSNIWLEPTSGVKLLDFGLARDIEGPHITRSGAIVGTPAYMAPEQARGEALDGRCDLFSLGCLLYRATTGDLPFKGGTVLATLRALEMDSPRPPDAVNPAVPAGLSELILRLLARSKEERCPSATAVVEELAALEAGRTPRRRRRVGRLLRGAALLVGLFLAGASLYYLLRPSATVPARPELSPVSELPAHFALQQVYPVGKQPFAVAAGDIDGDGRLDLLVSNSGADTISVLLGNGDGTFRAARTLASPAGPHGLLLADFDGDGLPDLAVVNQRSDTLSLFRNAGAGNFAAPVSYRTGKKPRTLARGDFDGDGRLDLAVVNTDDTVLSVFLGNGDGSFRAGAPCAALHGHNAGLAVVDLDHNGTADLVVSCGGADALLVLLGNGDGTFAAPRRYTVGSGPGVVVSADFNRDGQPDIAVENFGSNDVTVLLGNGDGKLRPGGRFSAGVGPGGLALGDFNGDDVGDLVVANHNSNDLSFLIGNGDGTFRLPDPRAAGWTPAGVAVGDFDGDGRQDAVVVNHWGQNVSVFLNRPPAPHCRLSGRYHVPAGVPAALAVTVLDARQHPDTTYRGELLFRSSDPHARFVVGAMNMRFAAADNGAQSTAVVLKTAGAQTWTATDPADPSRQGSLTVVVHPGPAAELRLAGPGECVQGKPFGVTVSAVDEFGNVATDYTGTVAGSSTDATAVLPPVYVFQEEQDRGVRRFEVTLRGPGSQTLTFADARNPALTVRASLIVRPAN